jgi:hypothetical protein
MWEYTKGGVMYDTLSLPTTQALLVYLHNFYGSQLDGLPNDGPIWVDMSNFQRSGAIPISVIADIYKKRLGRNEMHELPRRLLT